MGQTATSHPAIFAAGCRSGNRSPAPQSAPDAGRLFRVRVEMNQIGSSQAWHSRSTAASITCFSSAALACIIRLMIRVLLIVQGMVVLWAQGQPGNRRPVPPDPAIERGRSQFAQSCAFCHGGNANGGTHGPSLIRSAVVRHDEDGNLILPVVRDGRPDRGMPAIPLSPGQMRDIVAFLKSRVAAADIRSANRPMPGSRDKLLTGNAEAGKAFFEGAGGCSNCHSPTGDLAGISRKYPADVLQARFLYPQQRRTAITVTDAQGKQYQGDLLALTNYDVSIQDAGGWFHSWPLSSVKLEWKDALAAHRNLLTKYMDSDMHNMLAYLETLK
jgi:cytochrome c oxidase cbb3-type subunit 3